MEPLSYQVKQKTAMFTSPSQSNPPSIFFQIITALEEDSTAQKMQLGYRLQQIAAAVENKVTDLWPRGHVRWMISIRSVGKKKPRFSTLSRIWTAKHCGTKCGCSCPFFLFVWLIFSLVLALYPRERCEISEEPLAKLQVQRLWKGITSTLKELPLKQEVTFVKKNKNKKTKVETNLWISSRLESFFSWQTARNIPASLQLCFFNYFFIFSYSAVCWSFGRLLKGNRTS